MLCGAQSSHAPAGQSRTEALLEAIAAYWTDIKDDVTLKGGAPILLFESDHDDIADIDYIQLYPSDGFKDSRLTCCTAKSLNVMKYMNMTHSVLVVHYNVVLVHHFRVNSTYIGGK